ncbi:HAMP domain-containing sensor histidine kinase [Rheinheimera baltica]|uniref:sensor histidine kinase n=1 Tax=Rheinheimera baltica TaxID=67576 RepID=UPI00273E0642|nr:HAMP domain-containing sensor histidine kinase [Rheinheimera baltica]MDP5141799.1 HAMP domain-containing sensor histidine kinase [Rheinheimera baltica]
MQQLFWRFFLVFWATLLIAIVMVRLTFIGVGDTQLQRPTVAPPLHAQLNLLGPPPSMRNPAHRPKPTFWRRPLLHLMLLLTASLVFSWLLARYIALPIRQLKQALADLASNSWQTQLAPSLTLRRDEFGSLSRNFNQMAAKAAEAIASQRRLLHDVSHELRSPLARMQILTGLAQQPNTAAPLLLQKIEQEVIKLDALVAQILTFSQLDNGSFQAEHIDINLTELVVSVCEDAQLEANDSSKLLALQLTPVAEVKGDPSLLYSAIENVIRNAIKYTPVNTSVSVHLQQYGRQVMLTVSDQGAGIAAQHLPKLFTPFFRAQSTHTGIGLGLSIAKRAVEACNGNIIAGNIMQDGAIKGFNVVISLPIDSSKVQLN